MSPATIVPVSGSGRAARPPGISRHHQASPGRLTSCSTSQAASTQSLFAKLSAVSPRIPFDDGAISDQQSLARFFAAREDNSLPEVASILI